MSLRRLLLIDDDRLQARLVQQHLKAFRAEHFEMVWAATFETGLEQLLAEDFAVCLLDYQLGARDGLALIREAIERGCDTPIVFLTAESADWVDIEAMNAGALDYLVKGELSSAALERSLRYALKLGETLAELKRLATRDALTGLLNRRELDRILTEECERAARFGRPFSLVLFDLDRFKSVNDTYGHQAGDAVLIEVAKRLRAAVREVDRVARFGGEEIAVAMVELDAQAAMRSAERLVAAVREKPILLPDGQSLAVTTSAGVAEVPAHGRTAAELIAASDAGLYAAKRAGRNQAVLGTVPAPATES